jgi:hypothetical protein
MGVDHGRWRMHAHDILMTQQFLHGADILTCFEQMGGN